MLNFRLLCITALTTIFLPWIKTPLNEFSAFSIAYSFFLSLQSYTFPLFLALLMAFCAFCFVCEKLQPYAGWLVICFVGWFIGDISCNHRNDFLQNIKFEYEQVNRIFEFYNNLAPDRQNPLNSNFLMSQIRYSTDLSGSDSLFDSFMLTFRSLSYGAMLAMVAGVAMVKTTLKRIDSVWFGAVAVSIVTIFMLSVSGTIVGDMYLQRAQSRYEWGDMEGARKYIEKAGRWDSTLVYQSTYNNLKGMIAFRNKETGSAYYHLYKSYQHALKGRGAQALVEQAMAIDEGVSPRVVASEAPNILWSSGRQNLRLGKLLLNQDYLQGMANFQGGQDAFLYLASMHQVVGGEYANIQSIADATTAMGHFSHDMIVADMLTTIGCAYDRLGESHRGREMFVRSKDEFSLAKVINFRAQKGLIGM